MVMRPGIYESLQVIAYIWLPFWFDSGKPLKTIKLNKLRTKKSVFCWLIETKSYKNKIRLLLCHALHIPHHKLHVNLYVLQNILDQRSTVKKMLLTPLAPPAKKSIGATIGISREICVHPPFPPHHHVSYVMCHVSGVTCHM